MDAPRGTSAYTDFARLQEMRSNTPDNLRAAAQQFEALLADVWLKGMRAATDALGGGLFDSHALQVHQQMMDHQWAVHMAESGGLGIADVIVRQLEAATGLRPDGADEERQVAVPSADVSALARLPAQVVTPDRDAPVAIVNTLLQDSAQAQEAQTVQEVQEAQPAQELGSRNALFSSPAEFVRQVLPVVRAVVAPLGLNPLAVAAQAALETGWGRAVIAADDGNSSHNLFGIKASGDWSGAVAAVASNEFIDGAMQRVPAAFRAYTSVRASVEDLAELLHSAPRYAGVLRAGTDAQGYADALQAAGYATDPDYADKIRNILASPWFAGE